MEKILNLFKDWTKDNLFDLFWSGVVCAIITIPFILCELVTVTWSMVLSDLMIGYNINEQRIQTLMDLIAEETCNWIEQSWHN